MVASMRVLFDTLRKTRLDAAGMAVAGPEGNAKLAGRVKGVAAPAARTPKNHEASIDALRQALLPTRIGWTRWRARCWTGAAL